MFLIYESRKVGRSALAWLSCQVAKTSHAPQLSLCCLLTKYLEFLIPLTSTEIVYGRPLNHFWARTFRVLCTFQSVQFVPALRVQYT